MNKTVLMSIVAMAISIGFVSVGMTQQALAAAQPAAPGQKPASAQTAPARENWGKVRGVIKNVNEATKEVTVQVHQGQDHIANHILTSEVAEQILSEGQGKRRKGEKKFSKADVSINQEQERRDFV